MPKYSGENDGPVGIRTLVSGSEGRKDIQTTSQVQTYQTSEYWN